MLCFLDLFLDFSEKDIPKQPQPYKAQSPSSKPDPDSEEALYAEPYEEDPAFRLPPVPTHQNSFTGNQRVSTALINLEENAFFDSFEDEPLAEGVSNPLNLLADFDRESVQQTHKLTTADSVNKELEGLDFGFGPGNLSPCVPAATNLAEDPANLNFDFDFGSNFGAVLTRGDDPFGTNLAGGVSPAGNENFADFDLGKLDANFFEKLEAIEVTDQPPWGDGPQNTSIDKQELDRFWSDVDTSVSKLK